MTYFCIVFELKDNNPSHEKKLEEILTSNFNRFSAGIRQSEGLKIYMKKGKKLVME